MRPYCKIKFLEEAGLAKRVAGARYLRELESAGLVRAEKAGKEVLFINYRLVELLTGNSKPIQPGTNARCGT